MPIGTSPIEAADQASPRLSLVDSDNVGSGDGATITTRPLRTTNDDDGLRIDNDDDDDDEEDERDNGEITCALGQGSSKAPRPQRPRLLQIQLVISIG